MRRLLRRTYWIGNAFATLLVLAVVALMTRNSIISDQGGLKAILQTASSWTMEATGNLQSLADRIAASSPPLRVTFLIPGGIILADSGSDEADGKRMLRRPEVQRALRGGIGEHLDWGSGLLTPSISAAMLLDGRLIIHLSQPVKEIRFLLRFYVPGLVMLFLVLTLISRRVLYPASSRMIRQLDQVGALLEGEVEREQLDSAAYFPELRPAMENISYLITRMRSDLQQISEARDMQRNFVDNASHELKSPLTSAYGFAQMLYEEPELPLEQRQEYLGYILRECQRMISIINNILMLQQSSAPADEEMADVDMREVAEEVARSLAPQAMEKQISLHLEGGMSVRAVEQHMWELLRNLMSNAIRYGRQRGHVWVEMREGLLRVRDDGIGIEREHLPHIFEKFYRADKSRSRSLGGTGLGLSIVANITAMYGAAIRVNSEPGKGTTFEVSFAGGPAAPAGADPEGSGGRT